MAAAWPVIGAHVDSWAHGHLLGLDTFFTPWHALLYTGVVASALVLGVPYLRGTLPGAYRLSAAGVVLFGIGGVLDLMWHLAFGIERGTAGLLSPTHVLLMLSGALIAIGPLRGAWLREGDWPSWAWSCRPPSWSRCWRRCSSGSGCRLARSP